ncbi:MAG: hypothetical protein ACK414_14420 [Gemmobacter sp.]
MTLKLEQGRIAAGVWEAVLTGAAEAVPVEVLAGGRAVDGVEVRPLPDGRHALCVPIPAWALNEGVQVFLVQAGGAVLGRFTLIAGEAAEGDIRAELALLRAELDLLKRAFQRHAREG